MADDYLTKTIAVNYISMQSGYGRHVVEKTLNQLQDEGHITYVNGPDSRALLISREHVDYVIAFLKRRGQVSQEKAP